MQDYQDRCTVTCTNNSRTISAEVLEFRPKERLSVSLDRQLKMILVWNGQNYEHHKQGLEFLSDGPELISKWNGKR